MSGTRPGKARRLASRAFPENQTDRQGENELFVEREGLCRFRPLGIVRDRHGLLGRTRKKLALLEERKVALEHVIKTQRNPTPPVTT
jgi:hypothetical protein